MLVETEPRAGFPVDLPLEPDGSAPAHPKSAAGPIEGRLMCARRTAPHLRLVVPFRYGNRGIKAITQMVFAVPGLPPWNPRA